MSILLSDPAQDRHGSAPTIGDALGFLRRRMWLCIGASVAILVAAVLLAYKLPPVYRSEATILIEQQSIPDDMVQSTVTNYVDEQIQVVSQRVLTTDNVQALIVEFGLYAAERKVQPVEFVVQLFKGDTFLESKAAAMFDPRRGRVQGATFAFVLGFENSDPVLAQRITNKLADLYLGENVRSRREQASETTTFLEAEAERLAEGITEIEKRLAEYKEEFADALPSQFMLNTQMLDRGSRELDTIDRELINQKSKRDQLESQLSAINPYIALISESGQTIVNAEARLGMLRQEYLQLTGRYGPDHPDVVRVKREIEALSAGGAVGTVDEIDQKIASLQQERAQVLERYSPQHPDVLRLERSIAALEIERGLAATSGATPQQVRLPNNPEYLNVERQIAAIKESIRASELLRNQRWAEVTRREQNISIAPQVEKEWLALNRDYEIARSEYNGIKQRSTQARLSERLEAESKGDRFTLLESARLPVTPIEPDRPAIIFLGIVLALGAGIGLAALVDSLDVTVRSVSELTDLLGVAPLATIPYVESVQERRRNRIKKTSAFASVAAVVIILVWTLF